MALNTTATGTIAAEFKTYYDRKLLLRTVPMAIHAKFGQKRPIPKHAGKTIEFRRFSNLATATTPLTEGTLYTQLKDLTVTAITATIAQYGDAMGFSDLVSTVALDPILDESVDILAVQAGATIDEIICDVLAAGSTVQYAGGVAGRANVAATGILTPTEIRIAALTLKLNRAQKINGMWQAFVHPRAVFDLQGSTEWVAAQNYNRTGRIFDGSLGDLYGVRFWEADMTKVWPNVGVGNTVDVFSTLVCGANAYGIVDLAGHNLKTIYKALGSAGTADPLDQQQTFGWKVAFVAKVLNDLFMVRIEHAASTAVNV